MRGPVEDPEERKHEGLRLERIPKNRPFGTRKRASRFFEKYHKTRLRQNSSFGGNVIINRYRLRRRHYVRLFC